MLEHTTWYKDSRSTFSAFSTWHPSQNATLAESAMGPEFTRIGAKLEQQVEDVALIPLKIALYCGSTWTEQSSSWTVHTSVDPPPNDNLRRNSMAAARISKS